MNNRKMIEEFVCLCKMSQTKLKKEMFKKLTEIGYKPVEEDGFLYAQGDIPILLTAHLDTVHQKLVKSVNIKNRSGKTVISSLQGIGGDDRCGVYMILNIIKKYKCSVLFCEDEEIGCVGANKFAQSQYINDLSKLNYIIALDRANAKDAVFYDCDNPEFTQFILSNTGYKEQFGSYSDISEIAPQCGVAAVNLSCGYYHAHTTMEEVVWEDMLNTIKTVEKLIPTQSEQFEYIEAKYYFGNFDGYTPIDDYIAVYVQYYEDTELKEAIEYGTTQEAALLEFFQNHPDICYNDISWYDYLTTADEIYYG